MKKSRPLLFAATMLVVMATVAGSASVPVLPHSVAAPGFAVVELFTSEGCSSCPAADRAVADALKTYPDHVYVLGFHVDYWNYLGWKDRFSTASYGSRQQEYAAVFSLNGVYTPQVVVNGKTEFTGSDRRKLDQSIRLGLQENTNTLTQLESRSTADNGVMVTFRKAVDKNSAVCIALVQRNAVSAVKRGENSGAELRHVNVVRDFKKVSGESGTVRLTLPPDVLARDCSVVAFVQAPASLQISGAGSCVISQ